MNCLAEHELEQRIVNGNSFEPELQVHILNCDRCRQRYEYFMHIYAEMPENMQPAHMLTLYGLPATDPAPAGGYRLAAQSSGREQKFIVHHFSNPEKEIVGRILQEKETGLVSLYLIAAKPEDAAGQRILIDDPPVDVLTDDQGVARLGQFESFHCEKVHIQSPLAVFDLSPHIVSQPAGGEQHVFDLKNENHDEIHIEIHEAEMQKNYIISVNKIQGSAAGGTLRIFAITNTNRLLAQETEKGVSVFEMGRNEKILKIRIF